MDSLAIGRSFLYLLVFNCGIVQYDINCKGICFDTDGWVLEWEVIEWMWGFYEETWEYLQRYWDWGYEGVVK